MKLEERTFGTPCNVLIIESLFLAFRVLGAGFQGRGGEVWLQPFPFVKLKNNRI